MCPGERRPGRAAQCRAGLLRRAPGLSPGTGTRQRLVVLAAAPVLPSGTIAAVHGSLRCRVCLTTWGEPGPSRAAPCGWHGRGVRSGQRCRAEGPGVSGGVGTLGGASGAAPRGLREADACCCPSPDSAERVVQRFEVPGVSNYTALLLSPDGGTLYLGARELLVALNTSHFQPGAPARRVSLRTGAERPAWDRGKGKGGAEPALVRGSPARCSPAALGICASCCTFGSWLGWRGGSCPGCPGHRVLGTASGCLDSPTGMGRTWMLGGVSSTSGVWGLAGDGGLPVTVPSPQLPWSADEEKKRQCVFKGKDPQVSPAAGGCLGGMGERAVPRGGVRAGRSAEPGPLVPAERLSQLHQDAAAAEQHPPLHLRDLRLQPGLRLHREHGERGGGPQVPLGVRAPPPPSGPCSGGPGRWGGLWHCRWLTAWSCRRTCSTSGWSGTRQGRCCWRMGRDAAPSTPSTGPRPSWSVRHAAPGPSPSLQAPGCSAGLNRGRVGTDAGGGAGLCRVACAGSQRERLFGRRRALRWDCQQLPGQRADHLPQPGEPHRPQDRELPQLAAG